MNRESCLDTLDLSEESKGPKASISFESNQQDFQSPEEGLAFLELMQITRKRQAILEEQETYELARLKKLLDLDVELKSLGVSTLYFPDLENLVSCE